MYSVIPYQAGYALQVSRLYHNAVQQIAECHYSAAQKQAWSAAPRSTYHWHKRLTRSAAWLMVDTEQCVGEQWLCVGFINVETHYYSRGYIDSLYVLPEYQGRGIARALYQAVEQWALQTGVNRLSVDASRVSHGLFMSQGFNLHHKRYQEKCGQVFQAFYLSKTLS